MAVACVQLQLFNKLDQINNPRGCDAAVLYFLLENRALTEVSQFCSQLRISQHCPVNVIYGKGKAIPVTSHGVPWGFET
jgi:hypothetical protein